MSEENDSAGILLFANDTGKILLGLRSQDSGNPGTWCILGGHLEGNENPKQAAEREFREETGLDIPLLQMKKIYKHDRGDRYYHNFVAYTPKQVTPSPSPPWDEEHDDFKWVNPKELNNIDNLHPHFEEALENINISHHHKISQENKKLDEHIINLLQERRQPESVVRKVEQGDNIHYIFPEDKFEKLKQFLSQEPYNTDIEDSIFTQRERKQDMAAENNNKEKLKKLDRRRRSGKVDEPLHKFAQAPSNFEGRGWVVTVPKSVLEEIQEMVVQFKEHDPEKFKEAKGWYSELNTLTEEVTDTKNEKILFALLLAIGSINTPFIVNIYEAAVMFSSIKFDIDNGNSDMLVKYLNEDWDLKFALKYFKKYSNKFQGDEKKIAKKLANAKSNMVDVSNLGYNKLATYYSLNNNILSPLRSKTSGKLLNIIELVIDDVIDEETVLGKLDNFLDFKTKNIRDIKPNRQDFLRGMKVANFALNIISPRLAEDRMYELNTTIDTWMVKAFWPGMSYGDISSDPFAYSYLASQTAKLARRFDMLTQEMQAVIWVAMINKNTKGAIETSSAISEAIQRTLEYFDILDEEPQGLADNIRAIISQFSSLNDFKIAKPKNIKDVFSSMARRNEPYSILEEQNLIQERVKIRDYRKYASLVCEAYEARPNKEQEILPSYKTLARGIDKAFKKIQKLSKVKFINNFDEIGYRNVDNMKDRIEETGVFLVNKKDIQGGHPVFTDEQCMKFRVVKDYIYHILREVPIFGDSFKKKMMCYDDFVRIMPQASYPALFTELIGGISCNLSGSPSKKKACLLHGFDYNNIGSVDEDEYQKNFMKEGE